MITIDHIDGVGNNGRYAIRIDGKAVASITRYGNSVQICDNYYYEQLGQYRNVAAAKLAAMGMTFPTEAEAYENSCQRIEQERRTRLKKEYNSEILAAVYELANGSNSAHDRLRELVALIEARAKDRTLTRERFWALCDAAKTHLSDSPYYPDPPKQQEAA